MGSSLTNKLVSGTLAEMQHSLSNGAMANVLERLAFGASELSVSDWEKGFALWIVEHFDPVRWGYSPSGFDVSEIAWTREQFEFQRVFVLRVIDLAMAPGELPEGFSHLTERVEKGLRALAEMVGRFEASLVDMEATGVWSIDPVSRFERCATHRLYKTAWGCPLCNEGE
jgi:hypothetical protein